MRHEKIFKAAGRIFASGVLALLFLTLLCTVYCNTPVVIECPDKSTACKYTPNRPYCSGTEGFGWGKTNNDGYMNAFDYSEGMPISVLAMGSSHVHAMQIPMRESVTSRLNAMFESDVAYNIGVYGYQFLSCVNHLEMALKKYQPKEYVVIEAASLEFADENILQAVNEEPQQESVRSKGLRGLLRRNFYLRLLYLQWNGYRNRSAGDVEEAEVSALSGLNNERLLDELLAKVSRTAKDANVEAIILYHPPIALNAEGDIFFPDNPALSEQFAKCCADNGIRFLDMRERFRSEYENGYILPYGFSNTPVGAGHLNKYGHNMIAEELYRMIWEER